MSAAGTTCLAMLCLTAAIAVAASATGAYANEAAAPRGLLVDYKPSPAMGVSASPLFSWVVPHLQRNPACTSIEGTNQMQHSYQLQVLPISAVYDFDEESTPAAALFDSGRRATQSAEALLSPQYGALQAGATYRWRVRTWSSPDTDDACSSAWASTASCVAPHASLWYTHSPFCRPKSPVSVAILLT